MPIRLSDKERNFYHDNAARAITISKSCSYLISELAAYPELLEHLVRILEMDAKIKQSMLKQLEDRQKEIARLNKVISLIDDDRPEMKTALNNWRLKR